MCRHRVFWVDWLCGNGRNPPFSLELMFHCVSRYLVIGADACVVCPVVCWEKWVESLSASIIT